MKLVAHYDAIGYRVPGGETLWLDVDGRTVGVYSRPAYEHTDGTLEPGLLRSPIATEIRFTRYRREPLRVRPVVCEPCGDSGDSQKHTWYPCEVCNGYGSEKNLHLCSWCGEFSTEILSCAPRETMNHPLLLARMHADCAVASTVEHVRAMAS